MVKLTFSLDEATVARLRETARRLDRPQSWVVREAVAEYAARAGRLGDAERRRLLAAYDALVPAIPRRSVREVEAEIAAVRTARRAGGRRSAPRR